MAIRFPEPSLLFDPTTLRSVVAVGKHGKTNGELYSPRTVAIDPNSNLIYVVGGEYNSAFVSIFSETGEFLKLFTHKNIISPWGIAIYEENIYVTDASLHTVLHLKVGPNIRLVARLGGRGTRNGQFEEPRQLVVSTCGDVFVTDSLNHRIQILDCNLQYLRHILHDSMMEPCDVKLTPDEVVYVLDCLSSPCVHVFSYSGEKIRSIVTNGHGMQVDCSYFFCLDDNRNLIISDLGTHKVKMFSKEGSLIGTLGEEGNEVGMFTYPNGVALTKSLKLIVLSWNCSYGLQIFSY